MYIKNLLLIFLSLHLIAVISTVNATAPQDGLYNISINVNLSLNPDDSADVVYEEILSPLSYGTENISDVFDSRITWMKEYLSKEGYSFNISDKSSFAINDENIVFVIFADIKNYAIGGEDIFEVRRTFINPKEIAAREFGNRTKNPFVFTINQTFTSKKGYVLLDAPVNEEAAEYADNKSGMAIRISAKTERIGERETIFTHLLVRGEENANILSFQPLNLPTGTFSFINPESDLIIRSRIEINKEGYATITEKDVFTGLFAYFFYASENSGTDIKSMIKLLLSQRYMITPEDVGVEIEKSTPREYIISYVIKKVKYAEHQNDRWVITPPDVTEYLKNSIPPEGEVRFDMNLNVDMKIILPESMYFSDINDTFNKTGDKISMDYTARTIQERGIKNMLDIYSSARIEKGGLLEDFINAFYEEGFGPDEIVYYDARANDSDLLFIIGSVLIVVVATGCGIYMLRR